MPSDIVIGKDTGKDEFPTYLKALARFDLLDSFVFLLDGDARNLEPELISAARAVGKPAPTVIFLPGYASPEAWIWKCLTANASEYASAFSVPTNELTAQMKRLASLYETASSKDKARAKEQFYVLCSEFLRRDQTEVARVVGKTEAERGELFAVTQSFETAVQDWRSNRG